MAFKMNVGPKIDVWKGKRNCIQLLTQLLMRRIKAPYVTEGAPKDPEDRRGAV